jgi:HPt (histidine-containing phosphotransfer) domain-containing protein
MNTTDILLSNPSTRKIVFSFVDKLPEKVRKIKLDVQSQSRNDLKDHAHELKGTAANFGFDNISSAAGELETHAEYSSFQRLQGWADKVENYSLQVCNDKRLKH